MLKKQNIDLLYKIKMSEKALKFVNVRVNKNIHVSKQVIPLKLLDTDKIIACNKFTHSGMVLDTL